MKRLWDPQSQLSFFWGLSGSLRNPEACESQFASRTDANCVAAGVTEKSSVEVVQRRYRDKAVCPATTATTCNEWCHLPKANCTLIPAAFDVSEPLFLVSAFDPEIFHDFVSWITVIVMLSTGLCFEVYVHRYLASVRSACAHLYTHTKREHERQLNIKWKVAKCAFPVLMLVALIALFHHEAYGLLLFNAALWKVGFPEVTTQAMVGAFQLRGGLASKDRRKLLIYAGFNFGMFVGILMHHAAATIAYVFVLTAAVDMDQHNVAIFLLVILQHLCTCIGSVAEGVDSTPVQMFYYVCIAGCFATEALLQIELIAYVPIAESPVDIAATLFSASHFIMMLIAVVFFLTHERRVPTFYFPSQSLSLSDVEADLPRQSQGTNEPSVRSEATGFQRSGTTVLMSLDKWQLPTSVTSIARSSPSKSTSQGSSPSKSTQGSSPSKSTQGSSESSE